MPGLTAKAFEKYGFSDRHLVTDWPTIVGADLAAFTAPERLKWPPPAAQAEAAKPNRARAGAGRHAGAAGGRPQALDMQYKRRQIIERINAYFGYAAVAELRIVQAPCRRAAGRAGQAKPPAARAVVPTTLQGMADGALRDAALNAGWVRCLRRRLGAGRFTPDLPYLLADPMLSGEIRAQGRRHDDGARPGGANAVATPWERDRVQAHEPDTM